MMDEARTTPPGGEASPSADPDPQPPPDVTVRPARRSDARSYLDMWRRVVAERRFVRTESVTGGVRAYRNLLGDSWSNDRATIVAVAHDRVIGVITIERLRHQVNRHVATIGMAVDADWRARGVGSALMGAAMKWARSSAIEKVSLEVYPDNEAAVALYRKFGFSEEGRLRRQSKKSYGYEDEVIMSRWIADAEPEGAEA
jgi:L-phenylalanine/L-methionine N-acetyltransferase